MRKKLEEIEEKTAHITHIDVGLLQSSKNMLHLMLPILQACRVSRNEYVLFSSMRW